jgi:hypothetical protein
LLIASGLNRFAGFVGIAIKFLTSTAKQFRRAVLPYHGQERLCNFHNLAQSFYSGAWTEQSNRRAEFKWAFWFSFCFFLAGFICSLFGVFFVPPVAGMFESTGIDLRLAAQVALYKTCLRFGAEFSVWVCLGVLKIIDCFLGFSPESISIKLR